MRKRKEIELELEENSFEENGFSIHINTRLSLEVLLDIREILQKQEERNDSFLKGLTLDHLHPKQSEEKGANLRDNKDGTCNCKPLDSRCFFTDGFGRPCDCRCHKSEETTLTLPEELNHNGSYSNKRLINHINAIIKYLHYQDKNTKTMKLKEIHDFVKDITSSLQRRVKSEENTNLPEENKEYTKGQLYESSYILENIEQIIFKD